MKKNHCFLWIFGIVSLMMCGTPAIALEKPYYVDMTAIANTDLEDDGIRDNGAGGWTDEGINDMFLYPALPLGTNVYNGYPFHVIDPAKNKGRSVLILKGSKRCTNNPREAGVKVDAIKGKYVYFMQNAAANVTLGENYPVAVYTIEYSDGNKVIIPIRDGLEINQWWGDSYKGPLRWLVHVGKNIYTQKWNSRIGVWANRWVNPNPDKPITAIRFRSEGNSVPIIFAVTISDEDYSANQKRLPDVGEVPAGYLDRKIQQENTALMSALAEDGHLVGIRSVDLISRDIIAVTVDPSLTGFGLGMGDTDKIKDVKRYTISSPSDPAYKSGRRPKAVGLESYERWNGDVGPFPGVIFYWHTVYLKLPAPVKSGKEYSVSVAGIDKKFVSKMALKYDEAVTTTKVIKINQVTYSSLGKKRFAYLGWWAGDMGKVPYKKLSRFEVIDEKSGSSVLKGKIAPRALDDVLSGEDVYEMDISGLSAGDYHIVVPGLARSESFHVGGAAVQDLYYNTMRAFFHQRCGQECKEPWTDIKKAACHLWCWESGHLVDNREYKPKAGEKKKMFVGGWHDAADFDCFTGHLRAPALVMTVYEQYPDVFKDGQLNIPESGNGVPDVLDEAEWGLAFFLSVQQADGGVPVGKANECDAFEQQANGYTPYGILPVKSYSSPDFAAVAAQYARLIKKYDEEKSALYRKAAIKAYDYIIVDPKKEREREAQQLRAWAAAELFLLTGEDRFNQDFKRIYATQIFSQVDPMWDLCTFQYLWPYLVCQRTGVDTEIQKRIRERLIISADVQVRNTEGGSYRNGYDGKAFIGWGTGNGISYFVDELIRAYWLTKDQKYLDAMCLDSDFQLGANALSKTFVTGMGYRSPVCPEVHGWYYGSKKDSSGNGKILKGISLYGLGNMKVKWHPEKIPGYRLWRDINGMGSEISSEFTINQTIGPAAMLYSTLYALDTLKGK